jgi:hypothetical protein
VLPLKSLALSIVRLSVPLDNCTDTDKRTSTNHGGETLLASPAHRGEATDKARTSRTCRNASHCPSSTPPTDKRTSARTSSPVVNTGESGEWLPVLSTLTDHPEGALVVDLARELGVSVGLLERRLYALRRQGLVTSEQVGTPPVTTWRAL